MPENAAENDWPFEINPLHPAFGCEISGVTMDQAVSTEIFGKVYEAFLAYQLILSRNVDLPPATQVALARNFGEVQVHVMNQYHGYDDHPEIYKLTNMDEHGKPNGKHPDKGTLFWHTDGAWKDRVAPLKAVHNLDFSRSRRHGEEPMTEAQKAKVPPVPHPIVRAHPETARKAIFLGDHAESIQGWEYEDGRALIDELNTLLVPDELVYSHTWSPGECMVWDNRCLLHRAMGFDTANEIRVMRRGTTLGETPQS
ncbi:MAG: TauD/TfdA family dioxygenase [Alphaproteobacteria bacterium]|nr:TauD/TfdA family dioxygenase [Alphaproteobacteria bacterium]